jgi:hypothetical protein
MSLHFNDIILHISPSLFLRQRENSTNGWEHSPLIVTMRIMLENCFSILAEEDEKKPQNSNFVSDLK